MNTPVMTRRRSARLLSCSNSKACDKYPLSRKVSSTQRVTKTHKCTSELTEKQAKQQKCSQDNDKQPEKPFELEMSNQLTCSITKRRMRSNSDENMTTNCRRRQAKKRSHNCENTDATNPKQITPSSESHGLVSSVDMNISPEISLNNRSIDSKVGDTEKLGGNLNKEKARRRSSFTRGRVSHVPTIIPDITLNVPEDLSPEDRLSKMTAAVLQFTLNKLAKDLPDLHGLQQFSVQARSAGESCIKYLQETEVFHKAVSNEKCLPNPANEVFSHRISALTAYTDRLKQEFDKWNEMVEKQTLETEKAEKKGTEVKEISIEEQPTSALTAYEQTLLAKQLNYDDMIEKLNGYKKETVYAVEALSAVAKTLQTIQHLNSQELHRKAHIIYERTFADIKCTEDNPQHLLQDIISRGKH